MKFIFIEIIVGIIFIYGLFNGNISIKESNSLIEINKNEYVVSKFIEDVRYSKINQGYLIVLKTIDGINHYKFYENKNSKEDSKKYFKYIKKLLE